MWASGLTIHSTPIFNTCWPSTSVVNAQGVPPNFEHFPLHPRDTSKRMYHSPGSVITSGKLTCVELNAEASSTVTPFLPVTIGAGVEFKVESKECAILVLPQGASRERLLALQTFRAHVEKYAPQWYTFARDRVPAHGSLFVVTGCDKAASWGIATVSTRSSCIGASLKFTALGAAKGSLTHQYEWQDFGSATVRTSRNLQFPEQKTSVFLFKAFSYQGKRLGWPFRKKSCVYLDLGQRGREILTNVDILRERWNPKGRSVLRRRGVKSRLARKSATMLLTKHSHVAFDIGLNVGSGVSNWGH
ncbi:hypothetical protein C8J57DRAFT_1652768 [Mycena rebaudengoi]|nr:hypothetical protein C8J57DRAFT_1652768 [Mycena rebaudengoi]